MKLTRISPKKIESVKTKYIRGDTFYQGAACEAIAQAQLEACDEVVEATLLAFEGKSPQHCNQHNKFVDECMACHDICNENINWEMLERMREACEKEHKEKVRGIFEEINY